MRIAIGFVSLLSAFWITPAFASDLFCQEGDLTIAAMKDAQAKEFSEIGKNAGVISLSLTSCLRHPDPSIRDDLAYGGLTTLLRSERLSDSHKRALRDRLLGQLKTQTDEGFLEPFSALVLSEIARTDRVATYLSDDEFQTLVDQSARYLESVMDYRGFSDASGWRHGVAHGADWAMQLILNTRISSEQTQKLLDAIKTQIQAQDGHAYIHGEPSRLARPVLFAARKGENLDVDWSDWMASVANPAPLETWNDAFKSEDGLARLHNTKAFVQAIFINASLTPNPDIQALEDPAKAVLLTLP